MNKKLNIALLVGLAAMSTINVAQADEGRGFYVGAFGGAGRTDNQDVQQTGTAHKYGAFSNIGTALSPIYPGDFDLHVDVKGNAKRSTSGLAGIKAGYEWASTSSNIKPAFELEAMYLGANQNSNLVNPNTEVVTTLATGDNLTAITDAVAEGYSAGNHRFENHMNMNMGLFMANGVFTYETGSMFKPYVGAGVGLAIVHMSGATSYQTSPHGDPYEMSQGTTPVNHFNSKTNSNDYAIAGQVKLGLRAEINKNLSAFVEYRYLHINSTEFTYGSTVYSDHAPTDNWIYKNGAMDFNNGLVGIEYAF